MAIWNKSAEEEIGAQLARIWPHLHGISVEAPTLLSAGWESDIYLVAYRATDATGAPHTGEIVARLYYGAGRDAEHPMGAALAGYGKARREYAVLKALAAAGYPVPEALWTEEHSPVWARPVLWMTRVPGRPMWEQVYGGESATRAQAHAIFVAQMAALHALDVSSLDVTDLIQVGMDVPALECAVTAEVTRMQALTAYLPPVGLEAGLAWLAEQARAVRPGRVGVVHWDFHPENLLWDEANPARPMHVIDWTWAQFGDTRYDVAWSMVVVGAQEGAAAANALLDAYGELMGEQADMDYFLAYACFRRLYVMSVALAHDPALLGLRAEARGAIEQQLSAAAHLYARWREAGGPALDAIARLTGTVI